MGEGMKSFWVGILAAIVIAVVAGMALDQQSVTAGEKFSTANTRLN